MKKLTRIFWSAITLAGVVIGCGVSGSVDTAQIEKSFANAAAGPKADVSQAVAAIKSNDFAKAVTALQKVIKSGGLTDEQKEGVSSAITGMQIVVSRNQNKYSVEVYNALSDLVALLEGREPVVRPFPK